MTWRENKSTSKPAYQPSVYSAKYEMRSIAANHGVSRPAGGWLIGGYKALQYS